MANRGDRKVKVPIGDPKDPDGLWVWMQRHLEWMRIRSYSPRTMRGRDVYLGYFLVWCEARAIARPSELTRPILERYQAHLFMHRKRDGKPLSLTSQIGRMLAIRSFFGWLARQNAILSNPASDLELPRGEKRLPRHVLTPAEAEVVMMQPDVRDPIGVRDRAILETLYSTGIRRSELIGLKVYDLDHDRGTLIVRLGKGRKDRVVPIGERALAWIDRYLREVRPGYLCGRDEGALFVTHLGESIVPEYLTHRLREYVDAAELGKRGSCHLFRHTMATAMLENGADVRFVQEMLGHASLATTQIYTRVSIRKLKEIHAATHPSAKLEPPTREDAASDDAPVGDEAPAGDARAELLSSLAAEDDDDADEHQGEDDTSD
jgi:integrase/recombinase XerD